MGRCVKIICKSDGFVGYSDVGRGVRALYIQTFGGIHWQLPFPALMRQSERIFYLIINIMPMKTKNFLLTLLAALMAIVPQSAKAAFDEARSVYTMRGSDGLDDNVRVDGKITFVSQSGQTIPGYKDTGINFIPATDGEVLRISVDFIDLSGDNYLLLYENPIQKVASGASDGQGQSRYLPAGWLNKLTASNVGFTYQSTAANGGLSFGFHSGAAGSQKGFSITVESVPLKDMEYTGAAAATDLKSPFRGQKNAIIAALCVDMDGGLNPLTLNSLTLDCSALTALSGKVADIRLYSSSTLADDKLLCRIDAAGRLEVADHVLRSGKNLFYVVADIAPDAVGSLPDISVASLRVDGSDHSADVAAISPVAIANEIRFNADNMVYTVGEAADFYDDGGKDGKVGTKFEGSVTFVPATPGSAIKVDITKLAIFNTSTTGYNDVFSFYNGRQADAENLITTILKQPRFVKSTAPDGSMTVTFKSTTSVPADGFEAVVSEYVPGNMTITSVDAAPSESASTVSAMKKKVEMITFDILADNVGNPLQLNSVALSTTTPEAFAAVALYAVDNTSETPKKVKVATITPSAAAFTIPAKYQLNEGHNSFIVVADMSAGLLNGQSVDMSMTSVDISGDVRQAAASKQMEVNNVWQSAEGKNVIEVNGSWKFIPTHYEGSSTRKYAAGQVDQITTFRPANSGNVMQLDFENFEVYYATYASGVKATFEIYNGSECREDALLWKVDSSTKAAAGPEATIRSTAADGALTIKFNPNTTISYYLGSGWDAVVKEFRNHDMQIIEANASLPTDSEMAVGASDQPLLNFSLLTEGTLTVKNLRKINLSVVNSEALDAIDVYVAAAADGNNAVLFGRSETPAATTAVSGQFDLRDGHNYFFVKADVADDATPETMVSIGLQSVEDAAGSVDEFDGCTPEGGRVVKDIIICQEGVHTAVIAGPKMFYDDGGKDGPITKYIKATYTFTPAEEGYAVTVDSRSFSMGNGRMYVYSGKEASDDCILGSQTGYSATKGPDHLVSKAADGSVTIVITGPSNNLNGFALELGLHERLPFTLSGAEAASVVPAATSVRGYSDLPLLRVKASVAGDMADSEISDLAFSMAGTTDLADIKALRLYYAAGADTFSPAKAELLASVVNPEAADFSFNSAKSVGDNGDFYFFLTADLNAEATKGNTVNAAFKGLAFNGEHHDAAASAIAQTEIAEGVKGTFTIGSSATADFPTFKQAVKSVEKGIEGPVVFEIESGNYAENLVIENIPGTSAANTLTFRSKSGSRGDVVVKGSFSQAEKDGIVRIIATPYVNIENLTVAAGSAAFDNAIYVARGSFNANISNLDVSADKVTSGYTGISLLRTYASTNEAGQFNDNLTVQDCRFSGGRIGLYLASNGIVAWNQDRGYRILRNVLEGIGSKAVYVADIHDLTLADNSILEPNPTKNYYATDIYRVKGATISGNRIVNGSEGNTKDTNGLYFRMACGPDGNIPFRVFNNEVVYASSPSFSSRCLQISNDCFGMEIAYNTFRASGKAVYLLATSGKQVSKDMKVVSNVFHTECTDAASYPLYFWNSTDINGYDISGNAFYSANSNICKNDATVVDAAGFDSLVGNSTNIYEAANFVSVTDSHLTQPGNFRCGTPLEYVTVDREGTQRDAQTPTLGAYEYGAQTDEAPVIREGYPRVATLTENSVAVATKWDKSATLYALAAEEAADSQAPTLEQLTAGKGVEVPADAEYSWKFSALKPSTQYRAWFVAVNALGTASEIVASDVFTTARHIEPLTVDFADETISVNYQQSVKLEAFVDGGDQPYSYRWTANDGSDVSDEQSLTVTPETPGYYTLTVTSADNQTASARVAVEVIGAPITVATFEDFPIDAESHFTPEDTGKFYSGTFAFQYGGMPAYNFWYGFTVSSESATEYTGLDDQFRSAAGGGYDSEKFVVAYPQGNLIEPVGFTDGTVIPGFYINNSAYAYTSMKNGDNIAKKFEKGDWFLLRARITDTDDNTYDSDLFYLADFRDENPAEHYIVDKWEYVDLSHFGKIKSLTFLFDSSDKGSYGVNTPSYLCIDNFGCLPDAISKSLSVPVRGIELADHFDIDFDGTRTEYSLTTVGGSESLSARIDNGILFLEDADNSETTRSGSSLDVLVSMRQKGHTQRLALNLTKELGTGVSDVDAAGEFDINLRGDNLTVRTSCDNYSIDIYSPEGLLLHHADGLSGDISISRSSLAAGINIVRVKTDSASFARSIYLR